MFDFIVLGASRRSRSAQQQCKSCVIKVSVGPGCGAGAGTSHDCGVGDGGAGMGLGLAHVFLGTVEAAVADGCSPRSCDGDNASDEASVGRGFAGGGLDGVGVGSNRASASVGIGANCSACVAVGACASDVDGVGLDCDIHVVVSCDIGGGCCWS